MIIAANYSPVAPRCLQEVLHAFSKESRRIDLSSNGSSGEQRESRAGSWVMGLLSLLHLCGCWIINISQTSKQNNGVNMS